MKKGIIGAVIAVICLGISAFVFKVLGWYNTDLPTPLTAARLIICWAMLTCIVFETYLLIKK